MKKGLVFTMDVLMGLSLVIMIILTLGILRFESTLPEKEYEKLGYITNDIIDALSYLKAKEIQNQPTISNLIKEGVLTERDLDKSVIDLIASFWYTNNKTLAQNITREALQGITYNLCLNLTVDTETIYNSSCNTPVKDTAVATRIESGYEPGKPVYGYIARAFLTGIRGKRDSSYAYFGGYVGDGNITRIIDLPNFDKIIEAYMEPDAGNNFTLFINDNPSGFYVKGSAGGGNMTADKWVVCNDTFNPSYCLFFNEGNNTIDLNFTGNRSFIGGGYFKVTYNTTQMAPEEKGNTTRYYFPGIHGLINLYDSFYAPGNLNSMQVHLHYWSNYTVYLTIGNTQVYNNGSTEVIDIILNNATLSGMLNYSILSKKTVPLRMGTAEYVIGGPGATGNADVILITDASGSMNNEVNGSDPGINRNCDNPNLYSQTTRRISLAKCLDKEFVDIILNASGNRVGLVSYGDGIYNYTVLSNDKTGLNTTINGYSAGGGTCICCGINKAYEILAAQSDATRQKFVIVMTDGIPSYACQPSAANCYGNSANRWNQGNCYGWEECCNCPYLPEATPPALCFNFECRRCCACDCEMRNTNYSSCRIHNDLNATVHSVGFGPVTRCSLGNWTLRSTAQCGNGSYFGSDNAAELENIYRSIAESIVSISYKAQLIEVSGNVSMNNTLYTDSYIELNYTPTAALPYGEISLTRETERLSNQTGSTIDIPYKEGWFNVSSEVTVIDAKITSYSSEYWTDRLNVSNSSGIWNRIFWLADYGNEYRKLGDPYIVQIPAELIGPGNNSVRIGTGLGPNNVTGGSPDDRAIYTMRFRAFVDYGNVFNSSELADQDAIQRLIDKTRNYVNVTVDDVATYTETISGIRWLWGPSLLKIVVWEK